MRYTSLVIIVAVAVGAFLVSPAGDSSAFPGAGGLPVFSTRGVPPVPFSAGDVSFGGFFPGGSCTAADIMISPGFGPPGPVGPCPPRGFPVPDPVTYPLFDLGLDFGAGPPFPAPFTDDLDGLSYSEALASGSVDFDFSVDAAPANGGSTTGAPVPAACAAFVPNVTGQAALLPPEAQGDIFTTGGVPVGCNVQSVDEAALGLIAIGPPPGLTPLDDMDALAEFPVIPGPCPLVQAAFTGWFGGGPFNCPAFSISPTSAALGAIAASLPPCSGLPADGATILVPPGAPPTTCTPAGCPPPGAGPPCIAVDSPSLGLVPFGDDIDALCWWDANGDGVPSMPNSVTPGVGDYYIFSLAPGSASTLGFGGAFSPADLLTTSGIGFAGPPVVVRTAASLGLLPADGVLPDDNVDALICHDNDTDADGAPNRLDKCPTTFDPAQLDNDGDAVLGLQPGGVPGTAFGGDACDTDDDNDKVFDVDEIGCGTPPLDGTRKPELIANGVDDDLDGMTDEAQAPVAGRDCDGDGFNDDREGVLAWTAMAGAAAETVAQCGNISNDDPLDDAIVNDGCTTRTGSGLDHQDRCGNSAATHDEADDKWALDFNDNRFLNTSGDVAAFISPVARFNKPANYHPRWDLNADGMINIVDLNALGQSRPAMFGGQKALFKTCPVD